MTLEDTAAVVALGQSCRERSPSWRSALLERQAEPCEQVREHGDQRRTALSPRATYVLAGAIQWHAELPPNSIHAIVTDPPYGVTEYEEKNHKKLRQGRGPHRTGHSRTSSFNANAGHFIPRSVC